MSTFPRPVERPVVVSDISTAFPKGSKTGRKNQSGDTQLESFTVTGEKFLQPVFLYLQVLRTARFSSGNFGTTLTAFPGSAGFRGAVRESRSAPNTCRTSSW